MGACAGRGAGGGGPVGHGATVEGGAAPPRAGRPRRPPPPSGPPTRRRPMRRKKVILATIFWRFFVFSVIPFYIHSIAFPHFTTHWSRAGGDRRRGGARPIGSLNPGASPAATGPPLTYHAGPPAPSPSGTYVFSYFRGFPCVLPFCRWHFPALFGSAAQPPPRA